MNELNNFSLVYIIPIIVIILSISFSNWLFKKIINKIRINTQHYEESEISKLRGRIAELEIMNSYFYHSIVRNLGNKE